MSKNQLKLDSRYLLFILIGIAILVLMIYRVGADDIYVELYFLYTEYLTVLILAFLLFLTANLIRLIRWAILFKETDLASAFKVWLIGQSVNEVAPFGSGEITRAYIAKKNMGVKIRKTLVAMVIERTSDVSFLGVMALACAILIFSEITILPIIIIIFILLIVLYSILYIPTNLDKFRWFVDKFKKSKNKLLSKIGDRGDYWLTALKESLIQQRERKYVLLISITLTVFIWSIEAIGYYILLLTTGYDIPFYLVLIIISASWIIGVLSFLPGGLGLREGTFAVLMATLGVPLVESTTIALVYRGIAYILLGSGSFISILTLPKKKKKK